MKQENKIPLAHIKDGIEQYKNTAYTSKEWETLLYGHIRAFCDVHRINDHFWSSAETKICTSPLFVLSLRRISEKTDFSYSLSSRISLVTVSCAWTKA